MLRTTLNGDKGTVESFQGMYIDAKVRFCDSVTLTLDHHAVTFDDEAVFCAFGEVAVPAKASGSNTVMQASSYVGKND